MTLPVHEPSTLFRSPFAEYEHSYHAPTVATALFDQPVAVYGKHDQNLEFKDLYDFTRKDSGTLQTPRGLSTPSNVVPYASTFAYGAMNSATSIAAPMSGNTVIVDDDGNDIAILGTSELLSGSVSNFAGIFEYEMSARSRVITPAPETTPFRLFYTTFHVPVENLGVMQYGVVRVARWVYSDDAFGDGSFSATVSPTLDTLDLDPDGGPIVEGDIYSLHLDTYIRSRDKPGGGTITATVLGLTGSRTGDFGDPWITDDGDSDSIAIITTLPWPPGDMVVSGTHHSTFGATWSAQAELFRIRVPGLPPSGSLHSWAAPL